MIVLSLLTIRYLIYDKEFKYFVLIRDAKERMTELSDNGQYKHNHHSIAVPNTNTDDALEYVELGSNHVDLSDGEESL